MNTLIIQDIEKIEYFIIVLYNNDYINEDE